MFPSLEATTLTYSCHRWPSSQVYCIGYRNHTYRNTHRRIDNYRHNHWMDWTKEDNGRGIRRVWSSHLPTVLLPLQVYCSSWTIRSTVLFRNSVIALIFIGRAFISGAFQCAYVYTPEVGRDQRSKINRHFQVYPTSLRASGLGAASGMARIGAIITPFVAQVCSLCSLIFDLSTDLQVAATSNLSYPVGIYGTAALIGLISALSLPIETKGRQMQVREIKDQILMIKYCLQEHWRPIN